VHRHLGKQNFRCDQSNRFDLMPQAELKLIAAEMKAQRTALEATTADVLENRISDAHGCSVEIYRTAKHGNVRAKLALVIHCLRCNMKAHGCT
jgi:hypothetical protein